MKETVKDSRPNDKVILVIEDDPKMNELARLILEEKGFFVLSAYDWKTGHDILSKIHPDLVLLDLMLPDVKVEETCLKMGNDDTINDIPFIVMTALNSLPAKLSAFLAGARCFLNKPFSSDDLIKSIGRIFGEEDHLPFWKQVAEFQKETDDYIKKNNKHAGGAT
jgi:DNA-binding response OmpR family regulator